MKRRAFTLLEAVVSMGVLATAIIGMIEVISISYRASSSSLHLSQAVDIARATMETTAFSSADQSSHDPTGRYSIDVSRENKDLDLTLVVVNVTWNERGSPRTYRLERLVKVAKSTDE